MKKSVDNIVRPVQDRKNESLPSQKPWKEKSDHNPNDYKFRDDVRDKENIPVQRETWEELKHTPSEKPW